MSSLEHTLVLFFSARENDNLAPCALLPNIPFSRSLFFLTGSPMLRIHTSSPRMEISAFFTNVLHHFLESFFLFFVEINFWRKTPRPIRIPFIYRFMVIERCMNIPTIFCSYKSCTSYPAMNLWPKYNNVIAFVYCVTGITPTPHFCY